MQYQEGHILDGRYVLKHFIGSGSFGEVWLAEDRDTDVDVAIKIYISMDPQGLSDFKKEFQVSVDLNHTNLLHANYFGVCAEENRAYLVMPFCPDGSACKYLGKMDEDTIWRFIKDVSEGLSYLHDQEPPIIHQDIKPDNILISKHGDFLITDFGISKQLKKSLQKSAANLSSAGSIAYMGPERFSKQYHAVKASDMWALGVTIYELAVGELPFCGQGGGMQKNGADIPELPEEFSKELNVAVMSCLAKETWNRPTAHQLAEYAAKYIEDENPQPTWNLDDQVREFMDRVPEPPAVVSPTLPAGHDPEPAQVPPQSVRESTPTVILEVKGKNGGRIGGTVIGNPDGGGIDIKEPYADVEKIPSWVWGAVPAAGILSGILLNCLIRVL